MVVFRDDRGVKVPLFDSQVHCDQEGEKVSQDRREGGREGRDGGREGGREEEEKEKKREEEDKEGKEKKEGVMWLLKHG